MGWRILEELLVLVNDARAHHLRPPNEAIGISWLRVNVLQLLRELATPEDPAAFATLDARISLALAADKENPPVPSAQSPARLPGQAQKRSRRGCSSPNVASLPSLPLLPALEKLLSAWRAAVPSLVPSAGSAGRRGPRALPDDLRLLSAASDLCTKAGLVAPVPSGRAD